MLEHAKYAKWIWLIHFTFWLILFFILWFIYSGFLGNYQQALLPVFINICGLMILVYVHILFLLPYFFDKKKYPSYIIGLLSLVLITTLFRFFVGKNGGRKLNNFKVHGVFLV